ncbi:60S ribosomal protein L23a, partial [Hyalella azteca]|uniref:60S ribosomal protein L23a n=1 Tax=Hyalella azteca TaxID=294128 RepID=A0A8B7NH20_HYAAZ
TCRQVKLAPAAKKPAARPTTKPAPPKQDKAKKPVKSVKSVKPVKPVKGGKAAAVKPKKKKLVIKKAIDTATRVIKGRHGVRIKRIRTSCRFHVRPTLKLPRKPKYPRKSMPRKTRLDKYSIIKYPLTTEAAMKKIEEHNTLVFITDINANKHQIKMAVKKLYEINTDKINTLIRPDGLKKAYVKLASDYDALDVANKIGII